VTSSSNSVSGRPTKVQFEADRGLKRDVGKIGLLFTGVGSIIGSGWLFGAFNAAKMTGPSAVTVWAIGAIMVILVAVNYAELGVMFPVAGGVVRFPHYAFGSFASYTAGWITWVSAAATVAIEVLAAVQYASSYLPWMMHKVSGTAVLTGPGIGVSIALTLIFSIINALGVKAFARFNNVMVWWKLGMFLVVIVAVVAVAFHPGNFTSAKLGGFAPEGYSQIFAALPAAGIVFAFLGFRQGVEFAAESKDPRKAVPFAVIGSVVICGIIYVLLQIVFIAALPGSTLTHGWAHLSFANQAGPWAGIAELLALGWLAILLYIDAVVSPGDTGLIFAALTPRLSYSQGRIGNAPRGLTKLNKQGVPWVGIILMFVVACFMFLPFPSWAKMVDFITSGTVLSFGTGPIVVGALRRQLPDQERPYKLPGGDLFPYLGFLCANLIVYWGGWDTNWKLFVAVALGYIVLGGHYVFSDRSKIPPLHFKAGWWVLLWLGGLAVCSWLGHYSGGLDYFTFGPGELIVAAFTLVVYIVAVSNRLTPEKVVDTVAATHIDASDEAMREGVRGREGAAAPMTEGTTGEAAGGTE
jgi:amino acid transporter